MNEVLQVPYHLAINWYSSGRKVNPAFCLWFEMSFLSNVIIVNINDFLWQGTSKSNIKIWELLCRCPLVYQTPLLSNASLVKWIPSREHSSRKWQWHITLEVSAALATRRSMSLNGHDSFQSPSNCSAITLEYIIGSYLFFRWMKR